MKTLLTKAKILFLATLALLLMPASSITAQEVDEKKVTIKVKTIDGDETNEVLKEVVVDKNQNINELLEALEVLEDIDISEDGEKIEIRIKQGDELHKRVKMKVKDPAVEELKARYAYAIADQEGKGFLGVHIETFEEVEQNGNQTIVTGGTKVVKVVEGSAAEKAGLEVGDIITKVDDSYIRSHHELVKAVREHEPGETVEIEYTRDGKTQKTKAELGEAPANTTWEWEGDFDHEEFVKKHVHKHYMHASNKAFLGVVPGDAGDEGGVKIAEVVGGSAAEEMGLKENDIIKTVNGKKIADFGGLKEVLGEMEPGDQVTIQADRGGLEEELTGTLKKRESYGSANDYFNYNFNYNYNRNYENCDKPGMDGKSISISIVVEDINSEEAKRLSKVTNTDISEEDELTLQSLAIEFGPNPNEGEFNLSFTLPNQGETGVRIVDMNGKQVYFKDLGTFQGQFSEKINISDAPGGIYFLMINQNDERFTRKIVKN